MSNRIIQIRAQEQDIISHPNIVMNQLLHQLLTHLNSTDNKYNSIRFFEIRFDDEEFSTLNIELS